MLKKTSASLALLFFTLVIARSVELPPPRAVPVLPQNTVPNGPAIPSTPPTEAAHPAAILLWPEGAPGFEARKAELENIGWRQEVDIVFPVISNIHNPSITPFLPTKDKA